MHLSMLIIVAPSFSAQQEVFRPNEIIILFLTQTCIYLFIHSFNGSLFNDFLVTKSIYL
jgi:hypothetical protein